jgi:type I restriction enzyme S subunit
MNIPALRFQEFSGDWENKVLKEISLKITDGTHDTPKPVPEGLPYLTAIHIKDGSIDYENCYYLTEEDHNKIYKRCNPEKGDLLIVNIGAGTATCAINTVTYEFSLKNVALIKPDKLKIFPEYLLQVQRKNSLKQFNTLTAGGAQPFLSLSEIGKIKISLPSLPEQTKIANFLTAVDDKISLLTQKADLLSQYKKGLMQQIFSQELRFKDDDGQEFPEWEEKLFGDIFTFIQTNSFSRALLNYDSGIVKNIHYGDIHTKYKSNFKIRYENVPFINSDVDITNISSDCYCKEGDLVIADASEDYADIGKAIEIINTDNQKLLAGLHTYIARDLTNKMSLGFSGYLMQTESVRLQIKTLATGISVLGISKGNFGKVQLNIPTIQEQIKIANFLTAIDEKITNNQTQLNAVKQYKQGLLQQMFV